ncbi:MAG: antitoxin MazE family protein, partial [Rhodospirillaceae bacterium]|nr:antitoxin MazE family protein [Rhodospirillaceae bacterium]
VSDKVSRHRARLRKQGLRPVQIWVPDTRSLGFPEEACRQSLAVAESGHSEVDQSFVDAISEIDVG